MKKFQLKRQFRIQVSARKVKTYFPKTYEVPGEMSEYHALRARQMGVGEWLMVEKKAPENKVVEVAETKEPAAPAEDPPKVAKKRRGRPRAKPDAGSSADS